MWKRGEKAEEKKELTKKIEERKAKRTKYEQIKKKLEESDQEQISTTDPDSRSVILHKNIINVGYNIQASSDAKHKLLVEYNTGQVNDTHALAPIALQTKEALGVKNMKVLADKGYHTGIQLKECEDNGIETFVSPRDPSPQAKGLYPYTMFHYNKETDSYTCPAESTLTTHGRWYRHSESRKGRKSMVYYFKRYSTPDCKTCQQRIKCTKSKHKIRNIDRSEYAEIVEANNRRVNQNPDYYRQRQQVTEHMFGTLKRQRGFTHTLVRKKGNVLGEVGLMFIGYNLSRCISILGAERLIKALKDYYLHYFELVTWMILSLFKEKKEYALKISI